MSNIKYIDLFAGVGGFHYGIGDKGECVYSNEWDKYANSVYKKHYGECDESDIRTVTNIPDHDLLCAGFPCQSFSIAGKRGGFEDTRGTLFFEIARIARDKRPRYLLLENVKGLLSHDKGKTFQTIIGVLSDLGYRVEWQVLNSKHFGVPQNRERVFIIGHLGGGSGRKVFPIGGTNGKDIIVKGVLNSETWKKRNESIRRVHDPEGIAPTTPTGTGGGVMTKVAIAWSKSHRTGKTEADKRRHNYGKVEHRIKTGEFNTLNTGEGCRTQSSQNFVGITRGRSNKPYKKSDIAPTVRQSDKDDVRAISGTRIRRLTPVECERLQGFPDDWTKYGHEGQEISDTQRYKMMGNAVTTNVISAIMEKLLC